MSEYSGLGELHEHFTGVFRDQVMDPAFPVDEDGEPDRFCLGLRKNPDRSHSGKDVSQQLLSAVKR